MSMNAIIACNPPPAMEIPLTRGKVALVSPEDYERIAAHKWTAFLDNGGIWRAYRKVTVAGRSETVYMHRVIMDAPPDKVVDHWDGDGLNNRRGNLRVCTQGQNLCNTKLRSNKQSDAPKGVSWDADRGKWTAEIKLGKRRLRLGRFDTKDEAIAARRAKEPEVHGEYARPAL
jgi:hypothetical protein